MERVDETQATAPEVADVPGGNRVAARTRYGCDLTVGHTHRSADLFAARHDRTVAARRSFIEVAYPFFERLGYELLESIRGQLTDVHIEQPCDSYEECLSIRRHTDHPFVLDESINGIDVLLRGHADAAMDCVNIKISKFGGLTKAKQARDLCVALGIAMTIEDSWGGDIVTAAIAHLAHSTPTELLFTATDFNSYVTVSTAEGAPQRDNGRMRASTAPGLGVEPRMDVLGDPVIDLSA